MFNDYLEIAMIEIEPLIKPRKGMRILDKKKKNKKISIPFHTKKIHFLLHYFIENVRDIKKGDAISRCHTKKKKKMRKIYEGLNIMCSVDSVRFVCQPTI